MLKIDSLSLEIKEKITGYIKLIKKAGFKPAYQIIF